MRTFPSALAADLARRDGPGPVWLLRFTASGTDYILCQDAVTVGPWGKTALPWVASWGQLTEGVSSTLADFNVSSLNVDLINDPNTTPNLRTLAKSRALNGVTVSVYLWVDGCIDAPFEMFSFEVTEIDLPDEASVNVTLQDQSSRYERFSPGTIVAKEAHPSADPDDVGKVIPMPFGTVSKLNALALDSGRITSIPNAISATATSFAVSDATGLSAGMALKIDDEIVGLVSLAGDVLTVTRGTLGTLAATHQRGASAWELKDEFIYAVADFPVTSMPKAYGRVGQAVMDISEICTVWPAGNHPSYPGIAVISVPGYVTTAQAVDMLVNDGIDVDDRLALLNSLAVSDTISVNDLIGISDGIGVNDPPIVNNTHGHTATETNILVATGLPLASYATSYGQATDEAYPTYSFAVPPAGTNNVIYEVSIETVGVKKVYITVPGGSMTIDTAITSTSWYNVNGTIYVAGSLTLGGRIRVSVDYVTPTVLSYSKVAIIAAKRTITRPASTTSNASTVTKSAATRTGSVTKVNTVTKTGAAALAGTVTRTAENVVKTGTVTISGNSVANTLIGDAILVDVVSPITTPQDVITKILGKTCTLRGTLPAGFNFNGAITTSRRAPEWCHELARQCRSYFKWVLGVPTLIARPDVLTPVKSIAEIRLSGGMMVHGQRQTDINDVINTINLRYDRDWSSTSSGDEVYQQVSAGTNAASITTYGVRERPELFRFDFVTSPTMAANLTAFYLAWYAYQRWQHTQECYLFEAALEFGDPVSMDFLDGEIGECTEVGFSPGNGMNIDKIQLTIIE